MSPLLLCSETRPEISTAPPHRGAYGFGTVFKLNRNGAVSVLHAFRGRLDGGETLAGLAADAAGDLYGATQKRWRHYRWGTVFQIKP